MKAFFKISALILAAGSMAVIAGCSGCSGCAGCNNTVTNAVPTYSNWYTSQYRGIQPSFICGNGYQGSPEIISYSVEHDGKGVNSTYSVEYKDGSYRTEFYATYFDWNGDKTLDKNGYKSENYGEELVYCYRTELKISVKYALKTGESSGWFEGDDADSVINECYFRAAGNGLQPVYSSQTIKSATPASYQAGSLAAAYKRFNVSYINYYNYNCTEVTTVATDNGKKAEPVSRSLASPEYPVFDNSSLYIVARSLNFTDTLAQTVSLYTAPSQSLTNVKISAATASLGSEKTAITTALTAAGLYEPAAENDKGVQTFAVNLNYAGGELQGTTQTVWYAAMPGDNTKKNTSRATMLKMSIPLSYGLGTLNFTLKSVDSAMK